MKDTERTVIVVTRSSMLCICIAPGCTTIVFGRGTCVEHDEGDSAGTAHPPPSASTSANPVHDVGTPSSVLSHARA